MSALFIINDPPYRTERCSNALRLALALRKKEQRPEITVFLMADALLAAKAGRLEEGYPEWKADGLPVERSAP
jgi:uncharacterized protein involved in oxidation of intracellular sulfur